MSGHTMQACGCRREAPDRQSRFRKPDTGTETDRKRYKKSPETHPFRSGSRQIRSDFEDKDKIISRLTPSFNDFFCPKINFFQILSANFGNPILFLIFG